MSELNTKQRDAVMHNKGPILVIAGAGTGKTRVITERVAHILSSKWAKNDEVLGLTFTDKAAGEMEERLDTLMPMGYETVPVMTFHSFCDKTLRQYGIDIGISPNFRILQGVQQWLFLKERIFDFELDYFRPQGNPTEFISALLSHFSRIKEEIISPEDYLKYTKVMVGRAKEKDEILNAKKYLELAKAYKKYQELIIKDNQLDFSDLQYKVIELLRTRPNILKHLQNRYKYILVDEYQDTNIAQNEIVDMLAASHKNLMVVGDDDQSIYKFRGAAISNILQFEEKYPNLTKVVLTENYRSNQAVLDFAYASIQNNNPDRLEIKSDIKKELNAQRPGDDNSVTVMHATTLDQEVEYVSEEIRRCLEKGVKVSDIAILARGNNMLHPFIEALKSMNLSYEFPSEKGLYEKMEIKELISLLRVIANPTDDISFYRVLRMDCFNISMNHILVLIQEAKKNHQSIWSFIQKSEQCEILTKTINELIEFSKKHTAGEVLYKFTSKMEIYEGYLKLGTIEAEEIILSIAAFFQKLQDFQMQTDENSVLDFISYLDLAEEAGENPAARLEVGDRDAIHVSSVHAAKGLEFNTVFIVGVTQRRFPSDNRRDPIEMPNELIHEILSENDTHMQEERRLFYVASTRAKENLHLCHSDYYNTSASAKPRVNKRSRFIDEIDEKVTVAHIEKTTEGVEKFLRPKQSSCAEGVVSSPRPYNGQVIKKFSYSQLTTFDRCPRQYEYSYILKIPTPPNSNMSFGSTMHNTLQEFYRVVEQVKQASLFTDYKEDLSLERLLSIYEEKWIPYGYESRSHMETRKKRGKEILMNFHEKFKNDIPNIEFLEKGFKLRIGDYTIGGRIDRADKRSDGTLEIIDYKTGKSKTEKQVEKDLQLAIYALATAQCFNQSASKLTLYFLDEDLQVSVEPNDKTLEKAEQQVMELGKAINKSDFTPKPSKFTCKWCSYNKICNVAER